MKQRWFFLILFTGLVCFTLAEITCRVYFAVTNHNSRYLVAGFVQSVRPPVVDELKFRKGGGSYFIEDHCQNRNIKFTLADNETRERPGGRLSTPAKFRIIALGGSSTFGMNSPNDFTWPARLETHLRKNGIESVEVNNTGLPGLKLENMLDKLDRNIATYDPNWIVYYEGYNEGVNPSITSFHETNPIGKILAPLHYRVMSYTYLIEKMYFLSEAHLWNQTPDIQKFKDQLSTLLARARKSNANMMIVLQATKLNRLPELNSISLNDKKQLLAVTDKILKEHADRKSMVPVLRMIKTQILQKVAQEFAQENGIPFADPRPALEAAVTNEMPKSKVFCDDIHPGDRGNDIIGEVAAQRLAELFKRNPLASN